MAVAFEGTLGGSFRDAFELETRRKVGHSHKLAMPDREPTWEDYADLFEPTREGRAAAMRAAGFDKRGKALPRKGTQARKRRDAYRRRVERYLTTGTERRRPARLEPRERRVVLASWRRLSTPHTVRKVLELVWRWGATVTELEGAFDYEPARVRALSFAVGIRPAVLRRAGFYRELTRLNPIPWEELADAFLLAYGRAYGMGDYTAGGMVDVESFSYRLGFTDAAQYTFGSSSRPRGARQAPRGGPKYRGVGRR